MERETAESCISLAPCDAYIQACGSNDGMAGLAVSRDDNAGPQARQASRQVGLSRDRLGRSAGKTVGVARAQEMEYTNSSTRIE